MSDSLYETPSAGGVAVFPETQWSAIRRVSGVSEQVSMTALNGLCQNYWPPLYSFLRRAGHTAHDAQDLVQGFLARVIQRGDLKGLSPERGRFRSYLLAGLRNFAIKHALREKAAKRGSGCDHFVIDGNLAEKLYASDSSAGDPESVYRRRWATTILGQALKRLAEEQDSRGKTEMFAALSPFLEPGETSAYIDVARQLGMTSGAVAVAIHRLRLRLRELIRAEVLKTVSSRSELESELRELLLAWS